MPPQSRTRAPQAAPLAREQPLARCKKVPRVVVAIGPKRLLLYELAKYHTAAIPSKTACIFGRGLF